MSRLVTRMDSAAPPGFFTEPVFRSAAGPVEKDVEALLINQRKARRIPGQVPYPLHYSTDMVNFDNWNQMFLANCSGGLTMHQFETPPGMVLDLGCGGGFWVLEAAKQWQESIVVGFDINTLQPSLYELDYYHSDALEAAGQPVQELEITRSLASRVKWVHGNILDPLPFEDGCFDLVRIVGIGLGVPEDEWQFVLEEVARIMKSGAVLEIIEEDLIFPCPSSPPPRFRSRPPPISVNLPLSDSMPSSAYSGRTSATSSEVWSVGTDTPFDQPSRKQSSLGPLPEYVQSRTTATTPTYSPNPPSVRPAFLTPSAPLNHDVDVSSSLHSMGHAKLKAAWDAMLSSRFLAPQLITVLPFYLSSTFVNVQTLSSLQISLPPSPHERRQTSLESQSSSEYDDTLFESPPSAERQSEDVDVFSLRSTQSSQRTVPSQCAFMHLAKTVKTITACKEAIWTEYEKLYSGRLPPVARTARLKDGRLDRFRHSPREDFDSEWKKWESDMKDRMAMRTHIGSELSWSYPDWRVWPPTEGANDPQTIHDDPSKSPDLCRSLRGFIGWKASQS